MLILFNSDLVSRLRVFLTAADNHKCEAIASMNYGVLEI